MKKSLKILTFNLAIILAILTLLGIGLFIFIFSGFPGTIDEQVSPDGEYTAILQDISTPTPGNRQDGVILLKKHGRTIQKQEEAFWYDTELLSENFWSVKWEEDRVIITLFNLYHFQEDTKEIIWILN